MGESTGSDEPPKRRRRRPRKAKIAGATNSAAVKKSAQPFSEMKIAAQEAVTDTVANSQSSNVVPSNAKEEVYEDETRLNKEANRKMRRLAFNVVGGVCVLYVLVLLCVLWRFFDGRLLASVLGAPGGHLDWHLLVLIGVALVVFAAIPLSFTMALVKMISDSSSQEDSFELKTPNTELGKVLLELIKSMLASSKAS